MDRIVTRSAQPQMPSQSAAKMIGSITSHVRYGVQPARSRVSRRNAPNTRTPSAASAVYAGSGCASASIPVLTGMLDGASSRAHESEDEEPDDQERQPDQDVLDVWIDD